MARNDCFHLSKRFRVSCRSCRRSWVKDCTLLHDSVWTKCTLLVCVYAGDISFRWTVDACSLAALCHLDINQVWKLPHVPNNNHCDHKPNVGASARTVPYHHLNLVLAVHLLPPPILTLSCDQNYCPVRLVNSADFHTPAKTQCLNDRPYFLTARQAQLQCLVGRNGRVGETLSILNNK